MRDINRVLLIGVLILPFVAFAKSGTTDGGSLAFKGLVVAAPCSVKADDITKTVEMGQVRSNSFPSKGTWDDAVAFQLHLEDCDFFPLTEGKTLLHFSAKYRSTLNYVQPGDASSTVQFKMIYQ